MKRIYACILIVAALLILIPSRGYWFFESFPKRRTPGVCGAM